MVTLLSKLWIKSDNYKDSKVREKYGVLCGAVGIFLNVLLFLGKFFAGLLSGAISITADAFNNLSDAGSSFISMIGFKLSGRKPDPDHPFGHGRIEYISGLFVAVMIILMAYELIKDSIGKILHPELPKFSSLVAVILVVSIGVKIYMYFYNRSIGRKIERVIGGRNDTHSWHHCNEGYGQPLAWSGTGTRACGRDREDREV